MNKQTKVLAMTPSTQFRKAAFEGTRVKQLQALMLILGFVAWGAAVATAQLVNGNLNAISVSSQLLATPTGWTVDATRSISGVYNDGASSEPWANANTPDPGGASGLFFKSFQGNAINGSLTVNLYQIRPATPGLTYTLTGWAGAESAFMGLFFTNAPPVFALDFLNGASSVIGSSVLDLRAAGLGTSGDPFGYAQYSVTGTAPAGTVGVRARASLINTYGNPAGGPQAFVVDYFTLVPEPTTSVLFGLGFAAFVALRRRS